MVAKAESSKVSDGVKVVEYYRDYLPPFDAIRAVRRLLEYVPEKHLTGLYSVTLTNSQSTRLLRRGRTRSGNRKVKLADCNGLYGGGQVTLIVDKIYLDYPSFLLRLPSFRTYLIGEVLYHEIGHHIHRTQRPARRDKEFIADEWGDKLLSSYMRRRYWYFKFAAAPYGLLVRPLLMWLQRRGEKKGDG